MKYCIQYTKDFRYLKQVDEVIIPFHSTNLINIKDFSDNQRIIIDFEDKKEILFNLKSLIEIKELHNNIAIRFLGELDAETATKLEEVKIPFFFNLRVDKWDTLMGLIELGVSDVYIVNELGFELKDVSRVCKENNVNIRVFPNVAQTGSKIKNLETIKSFFIRPEDIDIYEPYVDVCEFFGPLDRQSVLYDIYTDKKWIGDLRELIIGLKEHLKSKYLMPCFGEERLNCGKKCYQNKCIICDKISTIAKQLEEANLEVKIEEKENEYQINEASNENKTG